MTEPVAVLELQRLDNTLDQLRYRHDHLPERAEIKALADEQASLERATGRTRTQHDDLRRRERALEDDANDLATKAKKLSTRLYDGSVTSPKEASAMGHEIEGLEHRQRDIEDEAIELMEQLEPLNAQLVQAEAKLGEITAKRGVLESSLATATSGLEDEIASTEAVRSAVAARLDTEMLDHYARLRITYGPDAIVQFDAGKGGGCPVAMSAVELDRWKHSPAGTVDHCVDCGRLVVKLD